MKENLKMEYLTVKEKSAITIRNCMKGNLVKETKFWESMYIPTEVIMMEILKTTSLKVLDSSFGLMD